MPDKPPSRREQEEDQEIDYLVCRQCNTPCYIFEFEKRVGIKEAQCLVCGNEDPALFTIGE